MAVTQQITDSVIQNKVNATAPPAILPSTPGASTADVTKGTYQNIGATGVLASPTSTVTAKPSDGYITDNSLVEKRLEALLAKETPLLKQAQLQANQAAAASGVANSGMATQLGTQALISKGLDIVSPDAALYGQASLARQSTENNSLLANQQANIASAAQQQQTTNQGVLADQTGAINYQATNQQGDITSGLTSLESRVAMDQAAFNAAIASASTQQQAQIAAGQKEAEMRFNESIQSMNLNADSLKSLSSMYATASASYITNVSEIMMNPDLDKAAKDAWVSQLRNNFYTHMTNTAALAGVNGVAFT